ncbi:tRNA (adenosine(37)-N6)-dimethylallyltransferase MiaA [Candidatus Daviesbacteria bacterium RIFCSPLOWO2_01_FULL_39_12]|uniref:tRNA dimethylallyltransferase n=1 Tax=Candidatus Daviesbacteria bacterium RIFCSPLOWO2_01_FULL_39_12 TaxID=1797785 RepID=A0A1F5KQ18_9BACT|nr:MAG: tRNA (adenosine(37)-N6)-dimethylallyltransferase MiaA [Candidatus Daviesbacteria bacterium RIFCSPLOWO2_01_FULL_39_12]
MKKLLVILGPTATGKTDLAINLAKKFNGELVSCDSRQVYKGLDIGTGKMPSGKFIIKKQAGLWIIDGVKIWMYDVVNPKKQYTVYDYVQDANKIIEDIYRRGKLPIIVGGTGLYLKALIEGLPNLAIPVDQKLRKKLDKLSKFQLQKKLQEISPMRWKSLNKSDRENPRRLIRAIELMIQVQLRLLRPRTRWCGARNDILKVGLKAPREILYKRIDERVILRINQGMIDEAKKLHKKRLSYKRMRQLGLEYGILADYLEGKINSIDGLIQLLQGKIHGYARRQITWFKKEKNVHWFDISEKSYQQKIAKMVAQWYD